MTHNDPVRSRGGVQAVRRERGRRVGMAMLVVAALVCGAECELAPLPGSDVMTRLLPSTQVATPIFRPDGGSFRGSIDVEIVCASEDAMIRYSLDGQPPSGSHGRLYAGAIHLSETALVQAVAHIPGVLPSDLAEAIFTKTETVDRLADCVGDYEGTFDGDSVGKLSFALLASGALLGVWESPIDGRGRVAGTVHADGSVEGGDPKHGAKGEGVFDFASCTAEGSWETAAGEKGRWNLRRVPPK